MKRLKKERRRGQSQCSGEKELKEENEEECKAQVLNTSMETERARERESHLLKDFFCSATARLLQLCGGVWERQSFRFFNVFCRVQDYK